MKFDHLFREVFGETPNLGVKMDEQTCAPCVGVRQEAKPLNRRENSPHTSVPDATHLHAQGVRPGEPGVCEEAVMNQRLIGLAHTYTRHTPVVRDTGSISLDAFEEAAAIAQYDGGLTRAKAEEQAARDQGFDDIAAFHLAVVAHWLRKLDEWGPALAGDSFRQRLYADARAFCNTAWALRALELGWHELDIFAVNAVAPAARFDGRGLVAALDGRQIAAMTDSSASIRCPAGHTVTFKRRPFDPQRGAVVIWELET